MPLHPPGIGQTNFGVSGFANDTKINGEHKDVALRPDQIFALSLPFPLLEAEKASKVMKVVEEKLCTPVSLRSLAADDPNYRQRYGGDQWSRDSAYHQGTVWSWLLGPLIAACCCVSLPMRILIHHYCNFMRWQHFSNPFSLHTLIG